MGGTTSQPVLTIGYGNLIGSHLPTAEREEYKFLGWFTESESGVKVSSMTRILANTTFYAHWQINTRKIIFNGNGGFV